MSVTPLQNDRTLAASMTHVDIVGRLNYWAAELIAKGLIVEGETMRESARELLRLRELTAQVRNGL